MWRGLGPGSGEEQGRGLMLEVGSLDPFLLSPGRWGHQLNRHVPNTGVAVFLLLRNAA